MAVLEFVDRPGEVRLSRPPPGTNAVDAAERMRSYLSPTAYAAKAAASVTAHELK